MIAPRIQIMGWREWAALPDLQIPWIKVKVDTGARTSALHAINIRHLKIKGRAPMVEFEVHPLQKSLESSVKVQAPYLGERRIRSSNGTETSRPVVETLIQIGSETWPIEITLIDRDVMGFRMLLGREAIRGKFLVDPDRSFLFGRRKKKKRKALSRK